eukprot:gene4207-7544_t
MSTFDKNMTQSEKEHYFIQETLNLLKSVIDKFSIDSIMETPVVYYPFYLFNKCVDVTIKISEHDPFSLKFHCYVMTIRFDFETGKDIRNLRRPISTHYIYSEGSEEQLTCDSTKLDECLKKHLKNENEFPKACSTEMQNFKKMCGLRRGLNLQNIKIRNCNFEEF